MSENPELDLIKEKAAEMESNGAGLMEPGTQVKKKKGRPKKTDAEKAAKSEKSEKSDSVEKSPDEISIPTKVIFLQTLPALSNACVRFARTPQAAMQPQEMDAVAGLLAALMDKYAPNALNKYGLEITTAVMIGQYGFRVYQLKKEVERVERSQGERPTTFDPQPRGPGPDSMQKVTLVEKEFDQMPEGPHA